MGERTDSSYVRHYYSLGGSLLRAMFWERYRKNLQLSALSLFSQITQVWEDFEMIKLECVKVCCEQKGNWYSLSPTEQSKGLLAAFSGWKRFHRKRVCFPSLEAFIDRLIAPMWVGLCISLLTWSKAVFLWHSFSMFIFSESCSKWNLLMWWYQWLAELFMQVFKS